MGHKSTPIVTAGIYILTNTVGRLKSFTDFQTEIGDGHSNDSSQVCLPVRLGVSRCKWGLYTRLAGWPQPPPALGRSQVSGKATTGSGCTWRHPRRWAPSPVLITRLKTRRSGAELGRWCIHAALTSDDLMQR